MNNTIKLIILGFIICFEIFLLVQQYFFYTPHWNNNFLEANLFEGFLNGFFVFLNSILYVLHFSGLIDTPFYFFDHLNANINYLNGFAGGILTLLAIIFINKSFQKNLK